MPQELRAQLITSYQAVRAQTEALAAPLSAEDQQVQSMAVASPTKWHRGHTTWFFETFVLGPSAQRVHAAYATLFNSYYEAVGPRHARPARGLLTRPTCREIEAYRRTVDARVLELLEASDHDELLRLQPLVALGLAHEQQHQELMLTDILHAFSCNPLLPRYREPSEAPPPGPAQDALAGARYVEVEGGLVEFGAGDADGFCFDNELPRHRAFVEPFAIAERLVTVGEMRAFIAERGYETPSLWLSEGLEHARAQGWRSPLYSRIEDGAYLVFGLDGLRHADDAEPVAHLSFYEADALARFLGATLPSEHEWELLRALASGRRELPRQRRAETTAQPLPRRETISCFGDTWQWTRSAYEPYPGYTPGRGALGEYNGKFMVNQIVLRGGSCLTPAGHVRATYRNFWHAQTRFQMTGLRLRRAIGRM